MKNPYNDEKLFPNIATLRLELKVVICFHL